MNVPPSSTSLGVVGLTLTRANHVIHIARWWNPERPVPKLDEGEEPGFPEGIDSSNHSV